YAAGSANIDPLFIAFKRGSQSAFGYLQQEILHVAQSQHHDIGIAKALGYRTCWIERRQGQQGFGGTPAVAQLTTPDFHYASLAALADAVDREGAVASAASESASWQPRPAAASLWAATAMPARSFPHLSTADQGAL